jgi:phosphohistidine phosphatase
MRRLMLLRHSKTERAALGELDRDRKLMKRGRAEAPEMGAYMAHHGLIPELVLVSPATRTRETWTLAAAEFRHAPPMKLDVRIYNATSDRLFSMIAETGKAASLLVLGHNPGLHDLARELTASGAVEAREALDEKLPTSGLVVIDLPIEDWAALHRNTGRLERFVTPRLLEEEPD